MSPMRVRVFPHPDGADYRDHGWVMFPNSSDELTTQRDAIAQWRLNNAYDATAIEVAIQNMTLIQFVVVQDDGTAQVVWAKDVEFYPIQVPA